MQDERIALITGCSSGLGLALAQHCLARGYHVIATARHPENIALDHPRLHKRALELGGGDHIAEFTALIREEFNHLDLLINNAGYGLMGPLLDTPAEQLWQQFQTNSIAPLQLVRHSAAMLGPGSTVVNIGSVSAHLTTPFAGSYCASKAALHALNDALRMELRPFGVRVMLVRAGAIQSNFGQRASGEWLNLHSEQSRYHPIREAIAQRAGLSQQQASAAPAVARARRRRSPTLPGPLRRGAGSATAIVAEPTAPPRQGRPAQPSLQTPQTASLIPTASSKFLQVLYLSVVFPGAANATIRAWH